MQITRWIRCALWQVHFEHSRTILVGGIPTPLKNMKASWDYEIPNIWKNNICSKPPIGIYAGVYERTGGYHLVEKADKQIHIWMGWSITIGYNGIAHDRNSDMFFVK